MDTAARPDPRPDIAKAALTDAMVELVSAGDASKVSITAVCKRARVSRPTFYRYFHTPDDVLASALQQRLDRLKEEPSRILPKGEDAIPSALTALLTDIWKDRQLYRTMRPDSPYVQTKATVNSWIHDVIHDYENQHGLATDPGGIRTTFVVGGAFATAVFIVEDDTVTRDDIAKIGDQLWQMVRDNIYA